MNENEMKVETKELNEQETEKVAGGRIMGPKRFNIPKRPQQDEKKDGEGGGGTGGW